MENTYYTVTIAIKGNMVVGTALNITYDYAMPYDKTWLRDEYTFKEKSFDNHEEAQKYQEYFDSVVGIDFDKIRIIIGMEKSYMVKEV